MLTRRNLFALLAPLVLSSGLHAADLPRRPLAVAEVWQRTELYFGTSKPDNTEVSDDDFQLFIDYEVTPLFPDGLTLLTGHGQFRGSNGLIREKSNLLILFYPPQMRDAHKNIQIIRDRYKTLFAQESVLRVDSFSFVSF